MTEHKISCHLNLLSLPLSESECQLNLEEYMPPFLNCHYRNPTEMMVMASYHQTFMLVHRYNRSP